MSKLVEVLETDQKKNTHRFGSDYYIRQACLPSGAKKPEITKSDSNSSEENLATLEDNPQEDLQETTPDINFFTAKQIYLNESNPPSLEKSNNTNSLETNSLEQSDQELPVSSEITSDSETSLVNCYDVTQSVIYRKLSKEEEEIQTAEKFFDFESLEPSLNHEEANGVDEEPVKPVAKPRTLLVSSTSVESTMQVAGTDSSCKLLKYKDTPEDSFDAIPYVINRRSDNTLIKRIYSDPGVRSFALTNRNKLPITVEEPSMKKVAKPIKTSVDRKLVTTPKKEENEPLDNPLDKKPANMPKKEENKPIENLPDKKPASTSEKEEKKLIENTPEDLPVTSVRRKETERDKKKGDKFSDIDCFYARTFAEYEDRRKSPGEIDQLKEQKLVSNLLKAFSKSSINLSRISDESLDQKYCSSLKRSKIASVEVDDEKQIFQNGERSTSVKDLRKKFELFDAQAKSEKPILYSLTGRSISKQFKEKLREMNEDSFTLSQIHSLSLTNLEVEENTR